MTQATSSFQQRPSMAGSRGDDSSHGRWLIPLCWIQIILAAVLFVISAIAAYRSPSFGMTWRASDGEILEVLSGGAAERGGLKPGDHLLLIGGRRPSSSLPLFYFTTGQRPVHFVVASPGGVRELDLVGVEQGRERIRAAQTPGLSAYLLLLSSALRVLVNVWNLLLAAVLLALRPRVKAARIAALAIACYAGGNDLFLIGGFGVLLPLGRMALLLLHGIDAFFVAMFFALMAHFGLIFPRPFEIVRRHRALELLPYLVAAPIFVAVFDSSARLLGFSSIGWQIPATAVIAILGALLLVSEIVLLAVRLPGESDLTDRRRIHLVIVACVPGLAAWINAVVSAALSPSALIRGISLLLQWVGAGAGTAVLVYAIVRHRLFDIRPLVRRGVQYLLARGTLLIVLALPLVALALFLYSNRNETLAALVGGRLVRLVLLVILAAVALSRRRGLLDLIDRRFFREQYDARNVLLRLVTLLQRGTNLSVIGRIALVEIQKALHPLHASLWRVGTDNLSFEPLLSLAGEEGAPKLPRSSALARLLESRREALVVDRLESNREMRRLSGNVETWVWLGATDASLIVPLLMGDELTGFLVLGPRRSEEPYGASERELLSAVAAQLALTEDYAHLESLAKRDSLTEALNRHAFYSLIEKRKRSDEEGGGCVAIVDLNDLKIVNDTLGHAAGDTAIRRVATAIRNLLRSDDLVFRWGGDEFLVVVFGLSLEELERRLVTLSQPIGARGESSGPKLPPLTVSIGTSSFESLETIAAAIEAADQRMYARKQERREAGKTTKT